MIKVLLITNKDDITTDFVVKELQNQDIQFYRLNTEDICDNVKVTLDIANDSYWLKDRMLGLKEDLLSFTDVYYRRPELHDYKDPELTAGEKTYLETELFYTLEGIYKLLRNKHWLNSVFAIREAENKVYQLLLAKEIGFSIPDTILSNDYHSIDKFTEEKDCIIKPVHNARIMDKKKPQIVFTSEIEKPVNKTETEYSVNYIQERVEKQYDIRATFVGAKCFAVSIDSQYNEDTLVDWRKGEHILEHKPIELPSNIKAKSIDLMKMLGLTYSAIDFVLDRKGNYIFLEINPNGQWAWVEHMTGLPIAKEIVKQLCRL